MTLDELEQAISKLAPGEFAELREWFLAFDSDRWDEQIEKDALAERLDSQVHAALREFRSGQTHVL
jgi:hypothetical protein